MKEELKYLLLLELLNDADIDAEWSLITQDGELYYKGYIDDERAVIPAKLMLSLAENIKTSNK